MKFENHEQKLLLERRTPLYSTEGDTRSEYFRDYNRILHSNAFRRLKHKTQVYYNINNDHICTRMEHVAHVGSVSHSIAVGLGLDTDLTNAIAYGHDLGHAPFGHEGENVLDKILKDNLSASYKERVFGAEGGRLFWHEKNGLRFVDYIELLDDPYGTQYNLNLTYAVRDGIVSHCGEINENALKPRAEHINLEDFKKPGEYSPYTWEGCVVKISDKIAYLGRDIEDALTLNFLTDEDKDNLRAIALHYCKRETLNTTGIMHSLIGDICTNSSPEKGICLSDEKLELFNKIKDYNYEVIYKSKIFTTYIAYVNLVINSIFDKLVAVYEKNRTITGLIEAYGRIYPQMTQDFCVWLTRYGDGNWKQQLPKEWGDRLKPVHKDIERIYGELQEKDIYVQAIVDYISGMTDAYAIKIFNELLSFA